MERGRKGGEREKGEMDGRKNRTIHVIAITLTLTLFTVENVDVGWNG